jgi:hypothetical protein
MLFIVKLRVLIISFFYKITFSKSLLEKGNKIAFYLVQRGTPVLLHSTFGKGLSEAKTKLLLHFFQKWIFKSEV